MIYAKDDLLVLENVTSERVVNLVINNTDVAQDFMEKTVKPYSFYISLNGGIIIDETTK